MIGLAIKVILGAVGAYGVWYGYQEITFLRGTTFWEYRLIALLVGGILLLSFFEWLTSFQPPK